MQNIKVDLFTYVYWITGMDKQTDKLSSVPSTHMDRDNDIHASSE